MAANTLVRIAKWLGIAYAAAIATFLVAGADAPDAFFMGLLFIPWIVGPAGIAAMCVKASRTILGSKAFLILEIAVIASTAAAWAYLTYLSPDAQNGIFMGIFLPLYQFCAVILLLGIANLLGWRARTEWLKS